VIVLVNGRKHSKTCGSSWLLAEMVWKQVPIREIMAENRRQMDGNGCCLCENVC